ncbi:MFS transporter [Thalassotalea fusca]
MPLLSNIIITFTLLIAATIVLSKLFKLPLNIWLIFLAQPFVMAAGPVIVFIGGILSTSMVDDQSLATLPVTAMILGVALTAVPAALTAKKLGRKNSTLIGFFIGFVGSIVACIATQTLNFVMFSIASLLLGACTAFVQQLRFAAIDSLHDANDIPKALSILMLSGIFSAFLGPEIAVTAKDWISSPQGYTGAFAVLAAMNILAMLVMLKFKNPATHLQEASGNARPLLTLMKQPIFLVAIASAAIGFALMSYLMTATPLSMHHLHGHSLHDTKWVIQSHIAAMFIPSLFTAFLVKRFGLNFLLIFGTIVYGIVAVIAFSGEQVVHYWWALLFLGVGWNFLFLTGTSLLPQSYEPHEKHKVQAVNDFIIFGAQALASLLAGWVLFKAGWHGVVLSSIPFIVILSMVSWYYIRRTNREVAKC